MRHKLPTEHDQLLDEAAKLVLALSGQDVPKAAAFFRRRLLLVRTMKPKITAARLRERLGYDPETGEFTWIAARKDRLGKIAGSLDPKGYRRIRIDDGEYYAHHLVVLYVTGRFPQGVVDHRDGRPSNNVWTNLRETTQARNMANASGWSNKVSGLPRGVKDRGTGRLRYRAVIRRAGKTRIIGAFATPAAASAAYEDASRSIDGEFSYLNRL